MRRWFPWPAPAVIGGPSDVTTADGCNGRKSCNIWPHDCKYPSSTRFFFTRRQPRIGHAPLRIDFVPQCTPQAEGDVDPGASLPRSEVSDQLMNLRQGQPALRAFSKTRDLGFEPSTHAVRSHWGGNAIALQPGSFNALCPKPGLIGIVAALGWHFQCCTQFAPKTPTAWSLVIPNDRDTDFR